MLRTNIFPRTIAPKRTDCGFRNGDYENHMQIYKVRENGKLRKVPVESPLLKLPIDVIEDVVVADALHLLHLGVTKRLLLAYKDGHNGLDLRRWPNETVEAISSALTATKLPAEIHRAVRGIECLSHWKASECASFLHYIGIILLKHFADKDHYENFANLFCATLICSNDYYKRYLPVAQTLFESFIENYYKQFNSITSNIHNLIHIVGEVQRFGVLYSISAYPFENHLYQMKKMVRSGRLPLEQIINRIAERTEKRMQQQDSSVQVQFPLLKNQLPNDPTKFSSLTIFKGFILNNKLSDKWFLTKQTEIVAMECADNAYVYGRNLLVFDDLFSKPFASSWLNVYRTTDIFKTSELKPFELNNILCKLVAVTVNNETSFVPLHHTFAKGAYL